MKHCADQFEKELAEAEEFHRDIRREGRLPLDYVRPKGSWVLRDGEWRWVPNESEQRS